MSPTYYNSMKQNHFYKLSKTNRISPVGLYALKSTSSNYETGVPTTLFDITILTDTILLDKGVYKTKGYYDVDISVFVISADEVTPTLTDYLVYKNRKYDIQEIIERDENFLCYVREVRATDPYDTLTGSFEAGYWTKIAIDALIRDIKNDVFSGTAPSGFKLIPLAGTSALQTVWGTDLTGTASSYKEFGMNTAITGDTLDMAWTDSTFDDTHISIWGVWEETDTALYIGNGSDLDIGIYSGEQRGYIGDGYVALPSVVTSGHILINSSAANSLKAYHNGAVVATDTTVRSVDYSVSPSIQGSDYVKLATIGPSLSEAQITSLYTALAAFNARMGRI